MNRKKAKKAGHSMESAEGSVLNASQQLEHAAEAITNARRQLSEAMVSEAAGEGQDAATPPVTPPTVLPEGSWQETCQDCNRTYTFLPGDESLNSNEGCEATVARNESKRQPKKAADTPREMKFDQTVPNAGEKGVPTLQSLRVTEANVLSAERYFLHMWLNWHFRHSFYKEATEPEDLKKMHAAAMNAGTAYFQWKVFCNQMRADLVKRGIVEK